jgi:hypothetical protein
MEMLEKVCYESEILLREHCGALVFEVEKVQSVIIAVHFAHCSSLHFSKRGMKGREYWKLQRSWRAKIV